MYGKQYGIATGLGVGCVTYVKQAWLDAVGISAESITDWDSYYAMLKAFTTEDPDGNGKNDTYGVAAAGFIGAEAPYTNYLPQFWQNAYPSFTYDKNGVWYDGFNTEDLRLCSIDEWMDYYVTASADMVKEILEQLNQ